MVHLATSTRFWRAKGDNKQPFFGEHEDEALQGGGCGIGGDGGADKIFAFFFDGVLLTQKDRKSVV